MLIGEPPPTQADLRFSLFGFPVRVHPFFWIVALLLGLGGIGKKADPVETLIWVAAVFVSILVHELGHAFLQRRYGGRPWITLYAFGGLASCDDCDRSPRSQIVISLAGPMAGFLLAAGVFLLLRVTGHAAGLALTRGRIDLESLNVEMVLVQRLGPVVAYFEPLASEGMIRLVRSLLFINVLWGLVNLLPIYPLDGGRIARELLTLRHARQGIVQSLQLSMGTAALVAVYGLVQGSIFLCLMFGFLAYGNYQTLQSYQQY